MCSPFFWHTSLGPIIHIIIYLKVNIASISMFNEHCSSRPGGITLAVKRCWITLDFFTSFNALILYPWFYDYDMAPPSSPLLISFFFGVNSSVARIMLFDMPIPRCPSSPNLTHENFLQETKGYWNLEQRSDQGHVCRRLPLHTHQNSFSLLVSAHKLGGRVPDQITSGV